VNVEIRWCRWERAVWRLENSSVVGLVFVLVRIWSVGT
jgi:hypothetical protein